MTIRRSIATLSLAAVATLGAGAPALAAGAYPPAGGGGITVPDTNVVAGESITVSASGFRPGSQVTFTLSQGGGRGTALLRAAGLTETATANAEGVATATLEVPEGATGSVLVTATGVAPDGSARTLSQRVDTASAGAEDGGAQDLPKTGGDLTVVYLGAGLLAVGVTLVVVTRRRRSNEAGSQG